jgi:multiple sugar transport system substrate-binding protein
LNEHIRTFYRVAHNAYEIFVNWNTLINIIILGSFTNSFYAAGSNQKREQISLTGHMAEPRDRWDILVPDALKVLQQRHPEMDICINFTVLPYNVSRNVMHSTLEKNVSVDLISVDQIWLADFAKNGLLSELTNRTEKWGRISGWYQANLDGMVYDDRIYGIRLWTDQRMVWYWKDLLQQAGIDPNSLKTWNGFIASAKKLNDLFKDQGIEGLQLCLRRCRMVSLPLDSRGRYFDIEMRSSHTGELLVSFV